MLKNIVKWLAVAVVVVVSALLLFIIYAQWEFRQIKITHLDLRASDPLLDGIKIVYAVDFQYDLYPGDGAGMDAATFQKAIDTINGQRSDLILLGGDYVTYASNYALAVPYLKQLSAPLGVYGVFGNHDARVKDDLARQLENIRFLANETVTIPFNGTDLVLCGVEDLWTGNPGCDANAAGPDQYGILLTHNPDFFESLTGTRENAFDLTLAGHVHAGQVTLFGFAGVPRVLGWATRYGEKYRYGEKLYDGNRIYISSGLGGTVYNLPLRFGAQPEIVVIE